MDEAIHRWGAQLAVPIPLDAARPESEAVVTVVEEEGAPHRPAEIQNAVGQASPATLPRVFLAGFTVRLIARRR